VIRLVLNREVKDRFFYFGCPFVALKMFLKMRVVIPRLGLKFFFCVDGVYHVKVKMYLGNKGKSVP
jgi:hypothetical protein